MRSLPGVQWSETVFDQINRSLYIPRDLRKNVGQFEEYSKMFT